MNQTASPEYGAGCFCTRGSGTVQLDGVQAQKKPAVRKSRAAGLKPGRIIHHAAAGASGGFAGTFAVRQGAFRGQDEDALYLPGGVQAGMRGRLPRPLGNGLSERKEGQPSSEAYRIRVLKKLRQIS